MEKKEIRFWIEESKKLSENQNNFLNSFLKDDLDKLYEDLEECQTNAVGYPYIKMAIAIKLLESK